MLSASELGDRTATFELVSSAMRKGTTDSYFGLVQRCKQLATRESDPQAMLLLGKICLVQRRENEAFDWFSKATQSPSSVGFPGSSEALVHVGRILQSRKENSKAADAFRRAALELGDPSAYFYLSQMEEPGSPQQEVYLLKAASGGIVEAWHNLGSLELAKIEKQAAEPKAVQDYGMAREWFQVAAADGFGLSMLNMAVICKSGGQLESGVRWLERAEEVPEVSEQAKRLKDQWESQKK
jgi:TPR repeat protein